MLKVNWILINLAWINQLIMKINISVPSFFYSQLELKTMLQSFLSGNFRYHVPNFL